MQWPVICAPALEHFPWQNNVSIDLSDRWHALLPCLCRTVCRSTIQGKEWYGIVRIVASNVLEKNKTIYTD